MMGGMFRLTDKEIEVLAKFVEYHERYKDINVFSSEIKKKIAEDLGMSNFNILNIYIKSLTEKQALIKSDTYKVNPLLVMKEGQTAVELRWQQKKN